MSIEEWVGRHGGETVLVDEEDFVPNLKQAERLYEGHHLTPEKGNLIMVVAQPDTSNKIVRYDFLFEQDGFVYPVRTRFKDGGGEYQFLDEKSITRKQSLYRTYPLTATFATVALSSAFLGLAATGVLPGLFALLLIGATLVLETVPGVCSRTYTQYNLPTGERSFPAYEDEDMDCEPELYKAWENDQDWSFSVGDLAIKEEFETQHALNELGVFRPADESGVYLAFTEKYAEHYQRQHSEKLPEQGGNEGEQDAATTDDPSDDTSLERAHALYSASEGVTLNSQAQKTLQRVPWTSREGLFVNPISRILEVLVTCPTKARTAVCELADERLAKLVTHLEERSTDTVCLRTLINGSAVEGATLGTTDLLRVLLSLDDRASIYLRDHGVTPERVREFEAER